MAVYTPTSVPTAYHNNTFSNNDNLAINVYSEPPPKNYWANHSQQQQQQQHQQPNIDQQQNPLRIQLDNHAQIISNFNTPNNNINYNSNTPVFREKNDHKIDYRTIPISTIPEEVQFQSSRKNSEIKKFTNEKDQDNDRNIINIYSNFESNRKSASQPDLSNEKS